MQITLDSVIVHEQLLLVVGGVFNYFLLSPWVEANEQTLKEDVTENGKSYNNGDFQAMEISHLR